MNINQLYKTAFEYNLILHKFAVLDTLRKDIQRLINNAYALKESIDINYYNQYIYDKDTSVSVVDNVNSIYLQAMNMLQIIKKDFLSFSDIKNALTKIIDLANVTYPAMKDNSGERSKLLTLLDAAKNFQVMDPSIGHNFYDPLTLQEEIYNDVPDNNGRRNIRNKPAVVKRPDSIYDEPSVVVPSSSGKMALK